MWKPTNTASPVPTSSPEPQRSYAPPAPEPQSTPRPSTPAINTQEQATLGKSLVIKGEVTGSESLYIDGRVEGSINLPGNRVTVGRNGVVSANISAREVVVLGKVRGNCRSSFGPAVREAGQRGVAAGGWAGAGCRAAWASEPGARAVDEGAAAAA